MTLFGMLLTNSGDNDDPAIRGAHKIGFPFRIYGIYICIIKILIMQTTNLNPDFRSQLEEVLEDPQGLNALYDEALAMLKNKFPKAGDFGVTGDHWFHYWATRLAIIAYGGGPIPTIKFYPDNSDPEPSGCTIDMTFDYGS